MGMVNVVALRSGSAIVTATAGALLRRTVTGNEHAAAQRAERENVDEWRRTERESEKGIEKESGRGRGTGRGGWRRQEETEKGATERRRTRRKKSC